MGGGRPLTDQPPRTLRVLSLALPRSVLLVKSTSIRGSLVVRGLRIFARLALRADFFFKVFRLRLLIGEQPACRPPHTGQGAV